MFKSHPRHFYITYYAVALLVFYTQLRVLLEPWLGGSMPFTFRSDNFFNFSSGHVRRGLVGELLYQGSLIGVNSILAYSCFLLLIFAFCYMFLMPRILERFTTLQAYIITFSSLVISPGLDREVIILLPALYLYFKRDNPIVFNILLLVTTFVHEISMLIYLPLILYQIFNLSSRQRVLQGLSIVAYLAAAGTIIFYRPEPNFMVELNYWPQFGVDNLLDRFLYKFADMPFIDLLKKHGYILVHSPETLSALIGLSSFFLIVLVCLKKAGASFITLLYYFGFNVVFFILTVDYGRYFYLLFLLYFTLGESLAIERTNALFRPLERFIPKSAYWLLRLNWAEKRLNIILIVFALSPFGYWVGDTKFTPAFVQEAEILMEFELPKHAGE